MKQNAYDKRYAQVVMQMIHPNINAIQIFKRILRLYICVLFPGKVR